MGAKKKEALEQFNRDNILTAAAELFSAKGVDKTTMDDIASYADYSKSTIYVYFKSKEDIYNSVLSKRYSDLLVDVTKVGQNFENFEDGYYKLCNYFVEFEGLYPSYFASLMGEGKITNSRKPADISSSLINQDMSNVFRNLLEEGIKRKAVRKDIDIERMSIYMWTSIGGAIRYANRKKNLIKDKLKISKDEYLRYHFKTVFDSVRLKQ